MRFRITHLLFVAIAVAVFAVALANPNRYFVGAITFCTWIFLAAIGCRALCRPKQRGFLFGAVLFSVFYLVGKGQEKDWMPDEIAGRLTDYWAGTPSVMDSEGYEARTNRVLIANYGFSLVIGLIGGPWEPIGHGERATLNMSNRSRPPTRRDKYKPNTILLAILIITLLASFAPPLLVFWPVAAIVGTLWFAVAFLKNSKHFSLKSLFVFTTIVGLVLGYSQWRRNKILSVCERLSSRGDIFVKAPDSPRDFLWQRLPNEIVVEGKSNIDLHQALMTLSEYGDLSIRVRRVPETTE